MSKIEVVSAREQPQEKYEGRMLEYIWEKGEEGEWEN